VFGQRRAERWTVRVLVRKRTAGMPIRDLQVVLGHMSLTTTEHYLAESNLKHPHIRAFADKPFSF
jgi:site-specific recombinase XerD